LRRWKCGITYKGLIGWDAEKKQIIEGGLTSIGGYGRSLVTYDEATKTWTAQSSGVDGKGERTSATGIMTLQAFGKRCHEAKAADVDGDGDIDICSKPWRGSLHFYLRKTLVEGK
jgi:hypothetical protein